MSGSKVATGEQLTMKKAIQAVDSCSDEDDLTGFDLLAEFKAPLQKAEKVQSVHFTSDEEDFYEKLKYGSKGKPLEKQAPAMQKQAPAMQQQSPAMQHQAPAMQQQAPVHLQQAPVMQQHAPVYGLPAPLDASPAPVDNTNKEILVLLQQLLIAQARPAARDASPDSSDEDEWERPRRTRQRRRSREEKREMLPEPRIPSPIPHSPSPKPRSPSPKQSSAKAERVKRDLFKFIPKTLTFDGTGNWLAFKRKFLKYTKLTEMTSEECADMLCWCLTGKAIDYYTAITERHENMPYDTLLVKLDGRYGDCELVETAQLKFRQALQKQDESIEDWADRLQIMAMTAFRKLPEDYASEQVVYQFCQGLLDEDAAHHIGAQRPESIESALEKVLWFQHMYQTVNNHPGR
jgi:hypothetical protein